MRILSYLFVLVATCGYGQSLNVMTYNIQYDNPGDSINAWDNRKSKVFDLLEKYDADIIGVQEALHHQLTDIASNFEGYVFFGAGRDDGKLKGEHSAVFVKKDRFEI